MNKQPIGVFDSGVGGLSILQELEKILPNETFIFVADQKYIPYGGKTKDELIERVTKILEYFTKKRVKAVVMACNTATVYTIEEMRQKFDIPIIGTVPVIKTIASLTTTGKTAVLSTPATAASPYLEELINKFAKDVTVKKIGGSNLEELVEKGDIHSSEIEAILNSILLPLKNEGVDAIALGCTHYPFLRTRMQDILGEGVKIVDSGGAVARRLRQVLINENLLSPQKEADLYYTTGEVGQFEAVASNLLGREVKARNIVL